MLSAVLTLGLMACGGGLVETTDEPSGELAQDAKATKPKLVGSLGAGDNITASFSGTTPQGYTFVLPHQRNVDIDLYSEPGGATPSPTLRVYGPMVGTTVPTSLIKEVTCDGTTADHAWLHDFALPGPGAYVVAAVCPKGTCKNQQFRLAAGWGTNPVAGDVSFTMPGRVNRQDISGALERGKVVSVHYDATRYQLNWDEYNVQDAPCRMSPTMYYRESAGGAFTAYALEAAGSTIYQRDTMSAVIPISADAQFLEIYFRADQQGRSCSNPNPEIWDSNSGLNFVFPVPDSIIRFNNPPSTPVQSGTPRDGQKLALVYDLYRMYPLLSCQPAYSGFNLTNVILYYRWNRSGQFTPVTVAEAQTYGAVSAGPVAPVLDVPQGASDLEVYVYGQSTMGNCEAWDSNYGNNFHFAVQP
jgi:hypothetical protein